MTLLSRWIEDVRGHLDADRGELMNRLREAYVPATGRVVLSYSLSGIGAGTTLSMGLNTLRVFEAGTVAQSLTVVGGQQGSRDEAQPAGTVVRANPRFTDHRIYAELLNTLQSLSSPVNGLYAVKTVTFTGNSSIAGYDLPTDGTLLDVLGVRLKPYGPVNDWPALRRGQDWRLIRPAPQFPSGVGIRIDTLNPGRAVQVTYKTTLTPLVALDDDSSLTGLRPSAYDLPPLGAALRLMAGREVPRNAENGQPNSRRANEVPPGAVAASTRGLAALYQQRVTEEAAALTQAYGVGL